MWCNFVIFAPHRDNRYKCRLGSQANLIGQSYKYSDNMAKKIITLLIRTTKKAGDIRVRFRIRDGRAVSIFHKSDIVAPLSDLEKFDIYGDVKPKCIYNKALDKAIQTEKAQMLLAYESMKKNNTPITSESLERAIENVKHPKAKAKETFIDQFNYYYNTTLSGAISEGRKKHYEVVESIVTRFLAVFNLTDIRVEDVTPDTLIKLSDFITNEYQFARRYASLYAGFKQISRRNVIPDIVRSENTTASKMKMLKAFFAEMENTDKIVKSPFRRLGKTTKQAMFREQYNKPCPLTLSELQKVMETSVPAHLQETKDAFLLQCALGCRVRELKRLTMQNISVKDGIPYVFYIPEKVDKLQKIHTNTETPLLRYALDIVKKYQMQFNILKYIDGKSGYNVKIKELLTLCKIDRECDIYDKEKGFNVKTPLCSFASSKTARKTHKDIFAKVQVNKYVDGLHRLGSKAVDHYVNIDFKDRFVLMCLAFEQPEYTTDNELNVI